RCEGLRLSGTRRFLPPDPPRPRRVGGVQPEVHASLVRGLLLEGVRPHRVPVPRGLLLGEGRARPLRSAAAAAAAHPHREARGPADRGGYLSRGGFVTTRRGLTAIDGALGLIVFVLIVQMWLLTAALETFLAGHRETALPAALVSAVLFLASAALAL